MPYLTLDPLTLKPKKQRGPWHLQFVRFFRRHEKKHLYVALSIFIFSLFLHEIARGLEYILWIVTAAYFGCWMYVKFSAEREDLVGEPTGKGHFEKIPDYPRQFTARPTTYPIYVIRLVRTTAIDEDLMHFVRLSETSPAIVAAHPELSTPNRMKLYKHWHEMNPNSFVILEKHLGEYSGEVIGGSIILPLTQPGMDDFWLGRTTVLKIRNQDIAKSGADCRHLLIDTWIIDKQHRTHTKGFNYALILKHLSLFWEPRSQPEISLLAEPDNVNVTKLLVGLGFDGPRTSHGETHLYHFDFPPRKPVSVEMRQTYENFLNNLVFARTWSFMDSRQ